jgi:HSP20 family molecular chaperone IbpA
MEAHFLLIIWNIINAFLLMKISEIIGTKSLPLLNKNISAMKQLSIQKPDCSIYPGEYVPFLNENEVKEAINRTNKKDIIHPAVNITEHTNSYKIEVVIPGVKRDELLLYSNGTILSICAVNNKKVNSTLRSLQVQEFSYKWFDRHILLPEDADSTFISAQYRSGILTIHFPKASSPTNNPHTRIIVY